MTISNKLNSLYTENRSITIFHAIALDAKSANSSESMLKDLMQSQEIVISKIVELSDVASDRGDKASEDMAVQRLHAHEKQKWMLSSSL